MAVGARRTRRVCTGCLFADLQHSAVAGHCRWGEAVRWTLRRKHPRLACICSSRLSRAGCERQNPTPEDTVETVIPRYCRDSSPRFGNEAFLRVDIAVQQPALARNRYGNVDRHVSRIQGIIARRGGLPGLTTQRFARAGVLGGQAIRGPCWTTGRVDMMVISLCV